jgi:hypothetical protein
MLDGVSSMITSSCQGIVTGEKYTGGIAGQMHTDASMSQCFSLGTVNGDS